MSRLMVHPTGCHSAGAHGSPCGHSFVQNQLAGSGEAEPVKFPAVQNLHLVAAPQERFRENRAAILG